MSYSSFNFCKEDEDPEFISFSCKEYRDIIARDVKLEKHFIKILDKRLGEKIVLHNNGYNRPVYRIVALYVVPEKEIMNDLADNDDLRPIGLRHSWKLRRIPKEVFPNKRELSVVEDYTI